MTDTSSEAKTDKASGDCTNMAAEILRQLEHYFGDYNLPRDKFLKQAIEESEGGWISLDTMLKFQRLAQITTDKAVIIAALKDSKILETNQDKLEIRRDPSLTIPQLDEDYKKATVDKSVYCKGFEKENTTLDDLIKFFNAYEGVMNVIRRTWGKEKERFFKGSVFVTFKDKALAQNFLDLEEVKSPQGEVLIRKPQQQYFDEKDKEFEEKRKARQDQKKQNKKAKEVLNEEEEKALPKGTILVLEGFKNAETKREDIKAMLSEKYEVKNEDIAFVFFNKGEKDAKLRFGAENAAKDLATKITESLKDGEKIKVNDDEVEFKVLEGKEEDDFLVQCKTDIAQHKEKSRRGHKRGGRGGYKGNPKRQRTN